MKRTKLMRVALLTSCALLVSACGVKTMYDWNGYNYAVLKHYKDGTTAEEFANSLQEIVEKAEAKDRVPPGLYAEYGYALLEAGHSGLAAEYFVKEKQKWPEATIFMDRVLSQIDRDASKTKEAEE